MSEPISASSSFEYLSVAHEMLVVDESSMTIITNHTVHVRALRAERFFERIYCWTGSGVEKDPKVLSKLDDLGHVHKLHGPVIRNGSERIYLIDLGRRLAEGEEEIIEFEHTFVDVGRTFVPFLGHRAKPGLRDLQLRVLLPDKDRRSVRKECWREGSQHPYQIEMADPSPCERNGVTYHAYEFRRDRPEPGDRYRLTWL
ncbi:hypothetical protein EV580_3066 [Mycobacterium sp. BK086]|uniref:hypothetical protein n=1 Tax=Mycobacterium sp. BK086 TaxID=2512165 RepID=UPI00105D131A|nr:hypothetical protein [Mycobacterium sp. BK086]TDO14928.1 hypothetical protein EV580_3066 [Mycobacterium sp. BK086]